MQPTQHLSSPRMRKPLSRSGTWEHGSMDDPIADDLTAPVSRPPGRTFAANAFWLLVAEVGSKIASFIFLIIVARGVGVRDYGYFVLAISLIPLLLMFGRSGIDVTIVRELARDERQLSPIVASGLVARVSLGLIALVVGLLITLLLVDERSVVLSIATIGGALFFDEMSTFLGTVFKAFERMWWHALVTLANRIGSTVLAFVVLNLTDELLPVAIAYLVGSFLALLFGWLILVRRFPPISLREADRERAIRLVRTGAPLGIAALMNMVVFRLDSVLVQVFRGPAALAMYGIAYRFFESSLFVTWALANAALPRMSRDTSSGRARTFELVLALLLAVYLPLAVLSMFVADWVVVGLFSERYATAARAVPWLAWAAAFYAIAHLARMSSIALGKRREILWVSIAAALFNVAVNLVVIPRFGFVGAAVTTFATEVIEAVLLIGFFVRVNGSVRPTTVMVVPLAAAVVTGSVLALTDDRDLTGAVVGALTYAASLLLIAWVLARDTVRALSGLLRPRKVPPIGST